MILIGDNMNKQLGRVTQYESGYGTVVSDDGKYMFLDSYIEYTEIVVCSLLYFRGETLHGVKIAFFVSSKTNEDNKQYIINVPKKGDN